MGKPFEKTMKVVNDVVKPAMNFFKDSPDELDNLRALAIEDQVLLLEEVEKVMTDKKRKVALYEFGLMPQLFFAFDCAPFCLETYPMTFTGVSKEIFQEFIAAAEEAGAPSDVCSTDRFILGAALTGELPTNSFFVTGSAPCDGTRFVYPVMDKIMEIPTLYIEAPYTYGREAAGWYGKQIKDKLIPFMEEVTGKKFDIDRFREAIEESNRAYELMLDIFDAYTMKPSPHPLGLRAAPYGGFINSAGHPRLTKYMKLIHEDVTQRIKEGRIQPQHEEKYRVMWGHVRPTFDPTIYTWMEEQLGASVVIDTLRSTATLLPIDTTDIDTMLEGYAWQGLDMTMSIMRLDTRALLDFTINAYDRYNCDCMIITQHVGCNNICGVSGIWRRYLRERDIPALFIDLDYNDSRVLSSEQICNQIEDFFNTVMV